MNSFETDQLLEPGLKMPVSAPVPAQWRKEEYKVGKRAWPAAWAWIALIKPTSITKRKEQKRVLPGAYIYSVFQKNHLKRLGSRTASDEHELINRLVFFSCCFVRPDKHPKACLPFPFTSPDVTEDATPSYKGGLCVTIHSDEEHSERSYARGLKGRF